MGVSEAPTPPFIGTDNFYSGGNLPIRFIVIHCTVSPCECGEARDIAEYFQGDVGASAHYTVDPCETIQSVHDWDRAWHVGSPGNDNSLGIELCCTLSGQGSGHWDRINHRRMLKRAAELVSQLCDAYDVPKRKIGPRALRRGDKGICGHDDVRDGLGGTTHWDPGPYFPWSDFIHMIREGDDVSADEVWTHEIPTPHNADNTKMYAEWVASQTHNRTGDNRKLLREIAKTVGAPIDIDEQAIVADILAAMPTVEKKAEAVAAALPDELARDVVSALARRLNTQSSA